MDDWFEEVSDSSGVRFTYRNGREFGHYWLAESIGGGVAMIDYDQDGDLDLFFPGGGKVDGEPPKVSGFPCALYRNDGGWHFVDVTEGSGLEQPHDFSFGVAVGDIDRDGYPDIFLTCYRESRLYRNNRMGAFEDITQSAGIAFDGMNTAAVFADYDRDGWVDLFTTGYCQVDGQEDKICGDRLRGIRDVCGPWDLPSAPDRLYRNRGDSTFEDVTSQAGIRSDGKGLCVLATDLNDDGWVDFFVANDTSLNHLYLGGAKLPLAENGLSSGLAASEEGNPEGSMGVDLGDYDGDGLADLWFTNYEAEDNALCRHGTDHTFSRVTLAANLGNGRPRVGFGTGLVDFDSDGWLDIFVSNGHVLYQMGVGSYEQLPLMYRNQEGRRFLDVSEQGGAYFGERHPGRGVAVGDLDDDGAPDIVVVHQNEPIAILRNRNPAEHWYRLELQAVQTELSAVGARVSIEFQGRALVRHIRVGSGYLSHSDQRILLPAEDEQARPATVYWPSGKVETFQLEETRRSYRLIEGNGT
ncbi:MAG: CRTAC1 family protein [Planctomycetes bacterium]|nr:CRTAC1 family protein [Planctomycetota bacterium]